MNKYYNSVYIYIYNANMLFSTYVYVDSIIVTAKPLVSNFLTCCCFDFI